MDLNEILDMFTVRREMIGWVAAITGALALCVLLSLMKRGNVTAMQLALTLVICAVLIWIGGLMALGLT